MFYETRRRLALWYTAVTAILLLLFATGIYFYVLNTLIDRIDDTLKHVVEVVERSLVIDNVSIPEGKYQVNIEGSFRDNVNAVEDDHIDLEWFNPNGKLIWSTFNEPLNVPLSSPIKAKTIHLQSDLLLRQVTKRIEIERYVLGYLRVSHPWFEVTKPIHQLILDLTFLISLMIISVGAIGWLLSGIAMTPIRESYQSLKQFTADASHELRNPITTIQTNISMLLSYPEISNENKEKQLKIVQRLTKRLGNLVNDLLFLARSDSNILKVEKQPVPLDALLIEVIEEQRIVAQQKNINLSLEILNSELSNIDCDEEIFTLLGDWNQLARLFTNLISNALKYSYPNSLNQEKVNVQIFLKSIKKHQKKYLEIIIKDNGIGIPEEALPYIFDRFYRVDDSRTYINQNEVNGTGLGMAIAQAIVLNHQGKITVESKPNQGTTFKVILPV